MPLAIWTRLVLFVFTTFPKCTYSDAFTRPILFLVGDQMQNLFYQNITYINFCQQILVHDRVVVAQLLLPMKYKFRPAFCFLSIVSISQMTNVP